jgi:hypothetical protein
MNKVDVGFLTVCHKTVTNDEWTFVDGLQRWFKLASFVWVWMLSIFLIMHGRIRALYAFGVHRLLDRPGAQEHICRLVNLFEASKQTSARKE